MMQLRWVSRTEFMDAFGVTSKVRVLQYRTRISQEPRNAMELEAQAYAELSSGVSLMQWSEWKDVPEEET